MVQALSEYTPMFGAVAIDPVEETADLLGAVRAYELNASAVQSTKTMIQESLDLLR